MLFLHLAKEARLLYLLFLWVNQNDALEVGVVILIFLLVEMFTLKEICTRLAMLVCFAGKAVDLPCSSSAADKVKGYNNFLPHCNPLIKRYQQIIVAEEEKVLDIIDIIPYNKFMQVKANDRNSGSDLLRLMCIMLHRT